MKDGSFGGALPLMLILPVAFIAASIKHEVENGEMTHNAIMDDIGPSTPSLRDIQRRAQKAMEFARLARDRAEKGDAVHALQWMQRAHRETDLSGESSE